MISCLACLSSALKKQCDIKHSSIKVESLHSLLCLFKRRMFAFSACTPSLSLSGTDSIKTKLFDIGV